MGLSSLVIGMAGIAKAHELQPTIGDLWVEDGQAKLVLRNELRDVTDRFPLRSRTRRTLQTKTARYESRFHRLTRSAAGFS